MLSRSTEVRKDVSVSSVVVERAGDEGVSVSVLGRRGIGGGGTWPRSLLGDGGGFARADGWMLFAGRVGRRGVKSCGDTVSARLGGEEGGTVVTWVFLDP
jgi:hypothetical protein